MIQIFNFSKHKIDERQIPMIKTLIQNQDDINIIDIEIPIDETSDVTWNVQIGKFIPIILEMYGIPNYIILPDDMPLAVTIDRWLIACTIKIPPLIRMKQYLGPYYIAADVIR